MHCVCISFLAAWHGYSSAVAYIRNKPCPSVGCLGTAKAQESEGEIKKRMSGKAAAAAVAAILELRFRLV